MIVVQNNNNKVFAINSKGEEMWNIQLNSKILGDISSIDFYQNNKFEFGLKAKNNVINNKSSTLLIEDFIINPKEIHQINIDAKSAMVWGTNAQEQSYKRSWKFIT